MPEKDGTKLNEEPSELVIPGNVEVVQVIVGPVSPILNVWLVRPVPVNGVGEGLTA